MEFELLIDNRETLIKNELQSLNNVKIVQLDIGDIVFKINNSVRILIERKTIKDLSASIKDGRHREQKKRLLSQNIDKNYIYYLIEGLYENNKYLLPKKTIDSTIINTLIRDNFKIIRTNNIDETISYIKLLYEKLKDNPNKYFKENIDNVEYSSTLKVKKKENLTPSLWFQLILNQIPGISNNISKCITNKYNTINDLLLAYKDLDDDKCPLLLEKLQVDIANNKKRKIGKVISTRIYNYIFNKKLT